MVGCIGDDTAGMFLKGELQKYCVCTDYMHTVHGKSGMSVAQSLYDGGVRASVVRGANCSVNTEMINELEELISPGDIAVFQLEIPVSVTEYGIKQCKQKGAFVILNAAPAVPISEEILKLADVFVFNEVEAEFYCHHVIDGKETALREIRKMAKVVNET